MAFQILVAAAGALVCGFLLYGTFVFINDTNDERRDQEPEKLNSPETSETDQRQPVSSDAAKTKCDPQEHS